MIIPRAYAQPREFDRAVTAAVSKLGPEVIRVRYSFETDSTGDPGVFFRVLLTDDAARRERMLRTIQEIERAIEWGVEPFEKWGVWPYFNYRSESEQETIQEAIWA